MSIVETTAPTPRAYRVKDLPAILGVCEATIWVLIRDGHLKAKKIAPKVTVILAEDLDAYLAGLPDARENRFHDRIPGRRRVAA